MPIQSKFWLAVKQTIFNVIRFFEREKNSCVILLENVDKRLEPLLRISMSSVGRFKREFREVTYRIEEEGWKAIQAPDKKEKEELEVALWLRHPRVSHETRRISITARKCSTNRAYCTTTTQKR